MILQFVIGFVVLVAASYVGTTMALRGFFGRDRYNGSFETTGNDPTANDDVPRSEDGQRTDGVPRASDVLGDDERDGTDSRRKDGENR